MNPLIVALLEAGLIDRETAEVLDRQLNPDRARQWGEEQIMDAFNASLNGQRARVLERIRATDQLPPSQFWDEEDMRLWESVQPALQTVATERAVASAIQTGIDPDAAFEFANEEVAEWVRTRYIDSAQRQVGDMPSLNRTTREKFADLFGRWQAGELGDRGLADLLAAPQLPDIFGPQRSEAIAVTETTRIFTETQRRAESQRPDTQAMRMLTSADDRVCPICGPMHGQVRPITRTTYRHPTLGELEGPPFHTRCRCGETPETEFTLEQPLAPEEQFEFAGELPEPGSI